MYIKYIPCNTIKGILMSVRHVTLQKKVIAYLYNFSFFVADCYFMDLGFKDKWKFEYEY